MALVVFRVDMPLHVHLTMVGRQRPPAHSPRLERVTITLYDAPSGGPLSSSYFVKSRLTPRLSLPTRSEWLPCFTMYPWESLVLFLLREVLTNALTCLT